jgi:hypothetical protein
VSAELKRRECGVNVGGCEWTRKEMRKKKRTREEKKQSQIGMFK